MSIFFPDNEKRKARLVELSTDTQTFLHQVKDKYAEFKVLNSEINHKITQLYEQAGLKPPETTQFDILKARGAVHDMESADTAVDITNILVDVAGFLVTIQFLAPGVTALLVDSGLMAAETAATILGTVLGVEITIGSLAGGLIAGIIVAAVVIGIGLAIDAIEGAILRNKLREGIHQMDQLRASLKMSLDKAVIFVDSMAGIKRTLDTFHATGVTVTDKVIQNLIQKTVEPAIAQANTVTLSSVIRELSAKDHARGSWTVEDDAPHESQQPHKVFLIAKAPVSAHPSIPSDLKTVSLASPDTLEPKAIYPILKSDGYTYWPLSYIDNRLGMAIVAYDRDGKMIKRWDKSGARYIVDIAVHPFTNAMIFRGQANQAFMMSWGELGAI